MNSQPPNPRAVPRAALPKAGEVLMDRYRVERMVGSGGMAHVLAAKDVELGTDVAIKVLDPTLINDFDAKERFARESRAMASLSSAHTVRVYDVGHLASGLPFMVMELLEGRDLGQILKKKGSLPVPDACDYIDQACEAVAEAHAAGIIHRDLKPQNLFLTHVKDKPMIRVLDFGIARQLGASKLDTITRMGDMLGTLHYMSPEQIRNSKEVEPRSDVWALGACLYKLITGYPPFPQPGEAPLMSAILTLPPKPIGEYRQDVPAVVSSVVMRCLRKPLEERFASVNELRKALGEARTLMLTNDFQSTTEVLPKPPVEPPPSHKETLISPKNEHPTPRASLQMTMPLDTAGVAAANARMRVPTGPQAMGPPARSSRPSFPDRPSYPSMASSVPASRSIPSRAPVSAQSKSGGTALSFVLIIVAVAIGVFVAGLGLLFVLSRRH